MEAVTLLHGLPGDHLARHQPDLAEALNALGGMLYQVRQYDDVITTEQEAVALLQKLAEDHSPGWSPRPTSPTPDENSPALCCRTTRTPLCSGVCVRRCPLFASVRQNNAQWVSRADRSYLTGLRPELYRWWCSVAVWTKPTKKREAGNMSNCRTIPKPNSLGEPKARGPRQELRPDSQALDSARMALGMSVHPQ
jgi:hypothetical protein